MSLKSLVKQILVRQQNKRYECLLETKRMTYDEWIRVAEQNALADLEKTQNSGDESESFVLFLHEGVSVAEHAMEFLENAFRQNPEAVLIYGDEDVKKENRVRTTPWFKPDWSPDFFQNHFYFGGLVAVRGSFAGKAEGEGCTQKDICDYVVRAGGLQKGCKAIYHLPQILCHNSSREKMQEWLEKTNMMSVNVSAKHEKKMISVVIPSKDHPELLRNCFAGIAKASDDVIYEILVVDNGSTEENKLTIQAMISDFEKKQGSNFGGVQYLYEPMDFNFSWMCNLGASHARGNAYLFLNDDVELVENRTLKKMWQLALREYVGAVGLKLLYPDTIRIQHAGITNLPMGPVHKLQFLEDNKDYYFHSNQGVRNVIGVTAACLMIDAEKFAEIGGFNADLQVAFNDVDLCFKLFEAGYHNVCRNDIFAYHHESLSRGDDESTEKWLRLMTERKNLYENHPGLEGKDPYFGVGLAREGLDSRIRPAYEIVGNKLQKAMIRNWKLREEECRRDDCLMVRVEECLPDRISGYAVVLGDNNACYNKEVLFKNIATHEIYACGTEEQYRPDLVENMSDQVNVGLCGFVLTLEESLLPEGEYSIGIVATNRLNKGHLLNFSSRILKIEKR